MAEFLVKQWASRVGKKISHYTVTGKYLIRTSFLFISLVCLAIFTGPINNKKLSRVGNVNF